MFYYPTKALCIVFGYLYPMYSSYLLFKKLNFSVQKDPNSELLLTLLSSSHNAKKQLLEDEIYYFVKYWTVMAWYTAFEFILDIFLFFIPLYDIIKLVFVLWMAVPQTKGAIYLYDNFAQPLMDKHEDILQFYFSKASNIFQIPIESNGSGQSILAATFSQGGNIISGLGSRLFPGNSTPAPSAPAPTSAFSYSGNTTIDNSSTSSLKNALSAIGELGLNMLQDRANNNSNAQTSGASFSSRSLDFQEIERDKSTSTGVIDSEYDGVLISKNEETYNNVQSDPGAPKQDQEVRRRWGLW